MCTAEFTVKGKNEDPAMPGFAGTLLSPNSLNPTRPC